MIAQVLELSLSGVSLLGVGTDACCGGGAPLFFLRLLQFGSLRPPQKTVLEKNKAAMIPDEKISMA